jgi:hypothetical protein
VSSPVKGLAAADPHLCKRKTWKESTVRSSFNWRALTLGVGLTVAQMAAAQTTPPPANPAQEVPASPAPQTVPTAPTATPAPQTAGTATPTQPGTAQPEPLDPSRTDQTYQFEVDYWFAHGQPTLRGGESFNVSDGSVLEYPGKAKNAFAAQIVIPLPSRSDIRVSGFSLHGNGTTTLTSNNTYFSTPFVAGDYLSPSYTLQNIRISYEYLSLPWPPETKKWRLYTLYEIQYTNMKTVIDAPFKANVDANGNAVTTTATGSHYIVYPTFGLKLEYPVTPAVRLEIEGSAFGWPQHAGQWNADATAAFHFHNNFELRVGGKAFYMKTSPKSEEYFSELVYGVCVGLRYSMKPFKFKY